jgi:uncharacterized protein (TIGR01244 family)
LGDAAFAAANQGEKKNRLTGREYNIGRSRPVLRLHYRSDTADVAMLLRARRFSSTPKGTLTVIKFVIPVLLIITAVSQEPVQPIRNFVRVNEDFCTGGQPRLEHLQKLKDEGIKAIINLRPAGEHRAAEEEAKAKELGLRYFNIPVVFGDPKEEQVTAFLKITDDSKNRPAFIHCAAAVRVGAFWMIRRVLRDGWSIATAEEEAKKIGLRESPHLKEFARNYIEKHRKK